MKTGCQWFVFQRKVTEPTVEYLEQSRFAPQAVDENRIAESDGIAFLILCDDIMKKLVEAVVDKRCRTVSGYVIELELFVGIVTDLGIVIFEPTVELRRIVVRIIPEQQSLPELLDDHPGRRILANQE